MQTSIEITQQTDTELALFSTSSHSRLGRRRAARRFAFESLEHRNMLAVLVDVGHHFVEPDASGQTVSLKVSSTAARDAAVTGFELRAQIVTAKQGPYFESVRFAGDLWNTYPHVESGSPFPTDRTLASGEVSFTHGFEARADGTLVSLTIDTTGIPAGVYEFRLVGTKIGSSSLHQADGPSVGEVITNGTLQVRSLWQNQDNPSDTNGDGRVTPLDVLLILNELSKKGSYELPMRSADDEPAPLYDVNGDGHLSPLDPLGAINCLNGLGCATTPWPILAKVTPDFVPGHPDSTGVGEKPPHDPTLGNPPPPDEVDPPNCVEYELDEEGNPVPITNPGLCEDGLGGGPTSIPISTSTPAETGPRNSSAIDETQTLPEEDVPATTTVLSPQLVDASMFDRSPKTAEDEWVDELIDLGL